MASVIQIENRFQIRLEHGLWGIYQCQHHSKNEQCSWKAVFCHKSLFESGKWLMLHIVEHESLDNVDEIINALERSAKLIATAIADTSCQ